MLILEFVIRVSDLMGMRTNITQMLQEWNEFTSTQLTQRKPSTLSLVFILMGSYLFFTITYKLFATKTFLSHSKIKWKTQLK